MSRIRRVLLLVGLLTVLAGAIALKTRRTGDRGGATFSIARAAELAPGETAFFLAVPDVDRMVARWQANEVVPLGSLEGALSTAVITMGDDDGTTKTESIFGPLLPDFLVLSDFVKVEPTAVFLAAGASHSPQQAGLLVIGLRYRGKKSEVEGAIRRLKERLLAQWPAAKSELSIEQGIDVESFTGPPVKKVKIPVWPDPEAVEEQRAIDRALAEGKPPPPPKKPFQPSAHIAFHDDWVFFGTDRAMLAGTLARNVGAAGAGKSLAQEPRFMECRGQALPEADFCLWTRGKTSPVPWWVEPFRGEPPANPSEEDEELRAAHFEGRVDGATSGRLYLLEGKPKEALHGRTGVVPELSSRFGPDLTFVFREGGVAKLEMHGEAEAFRHASAVARASREAMHLDEPGLPLASPGKPLSFSPPEKLSFDADGRMGVPASGLAVETGAPGARAEAGTLYYSEVPDFFRDGMLELPHVQLPFEPWLVPRRKEGLPAGRVLPAKIRVREDLRNWVIESDLNVLGPKLFWEMMWRP